MATRAATEMHTSVPPLSPERPVTWPKRTRTRLANGLEVVLAESHTVPKFTGELYFRSGNAAAAANAPGLAEITASVLRTGTEARSSRQIEEDLRRIGAHPDHVAVAEAGDGIDTVVGGINGEVIGPQHALGDQLEDIERAAIIKALEQTRYNKTAAAKLLGMTFRALRYRIKKLGIE